MKRRKKSKIPCRTYNLSISVFTFLICLTLNLFPFRRETLAQRAAKRAKVPASSESVIVIEDEPEVTTEGAPETTLPGSETSLRRSPQRKFSTHFPLSGARERSSFADVFVGRAGEEQQHQEPPEVAPDIPSLSTTPPRSGSPARASVEEPIRAERMPASAEAASGSASDPSATEAAAPGLNTGNLLALKPPLFISSLELLL